MPLSGARPERPYRGRRPAAHHLAKRVGKDIDTKSETTNLHTFTCIRGRNAPLIRDGEIGTHEEDGIGVGVGSAASPSQLNTLPRCACWGDRK